MGILMRTVPEDDSTRVNEVSSFDMSYNPTAREVVLRYHCEAAPSFTVLVPDGMAMQMVAQFLKKRLFCLH